MKGSEVYPRAVLAALAGVAGDEAIDWANEVEVVVGERERDCIDVDPKKPAIVYHTAEGVQNPVVCLHELFHLWHSKKFPELTAAAPAVGCEAVAIMGELSAGYLFPPWAWPVLCRIIGHHSDEVVCLAGQAMRLTEKSFEEKARWLLTPH